MPKRKEKKILEHSHLCYIKGDGIQYAIHCGKVKKKTWDENVG